MMKPAFVLFLKKSLTHNRALWGLIFFSIIVSMMNENFLTTENILNILRQASINAIIAAGMTFVILTAGIDLSVGSVLAMCGALGAASLGSWGFNLYLSFVIALGAGMFFGLLNGILISYGRLQPFIMTLITLTFLRGTTLVFSDGRPISTGFSAAAERFDEFGNGYLFSIPIPVYFIVIIYLLSWYILSYTRIGLYIYAVGINEAAAKLAGIRTELVKLFVYSYAGLLAAFAGLILAARLGSATPTAGIAYELDAIAAVVIGGVSLAGGRGSIAGVLTGAILISILANALNILNVPAYYQMIVKALIILFAVLLDRKT